MSAINCVCGSPAGINAGSSGCTIEMKPMAFPIFEYEKKADVIMEAIRSGNFIYDLSGSAR